MSENNILKIQGNRRSIGEYLDGMAVILGVAFIIIVLVLTSVDYHKYVSPEKVKYVIASPNGSISIYLGPDTERLIDIFDKVFFVTVSSDYIKEGILLKSTDGSLSDGLDSSAHWEDGMFFSSKHNTFTDFKIVSIDMTEKKAVVQIAAKLFNQKSDEYIEFEKKSFEITGKNFDRFIKFNI